MVVDILMATYNGERFLRNQLLSLQQQTHTDWLLWIRDDGSTDGTLAIIADFARADGRIRIVEEDSGRGLGAGRNFLGLARYSTADFAIYCDQDDIWFEKKLELLLAFAAAKCDAHSPCCVHCDAYGYSDRQGVITIPSVSRRHAANLAEFLFLNAGYQGCSLLFNRALADLVADYQADEYYMHDDVVSLLGHVFGQVHFLDQRLMLYRQHDTNVTGNIDHGLKARFARLFGRRSFVLDQKHYDEKRAFYRAYHDAMDERARRLFAAYLDFPCRSLGGRLWLIGRHGFSIGGRRLPLYVKTVLRRPLG